MAKNSFSLNTVLKLNSKEFKRGIQDVQKSLKSLMTSFKQFAASIGAGLGIYQLISQLKQATIEMDTAKAVLKNVSVVTNDAGIAIDHYAANLLYLKRLARDYKQDQAGLIESFAKFSAAANGANVALEDQKNIFESLTRASAFYHLSGDQTKNVMMAIEQMMSKGKVTAEELRRQLGNSLPGAYQLMAKAMGVTTSKFEEMMSKGLVKATDALPKFAVELNKLTAGLEGTGALDSLALNLNALGNAFKEFADQSGFNNFLNNLTKAATAGIKSVIDNMGLFKDIIASLAVALPLRWAFLKLKKNGEEALITLGKEADVLKEKITAFETKYKTSFSDMLKGRNMLDWEEMSGAEIKANERIPTNQISRLQALARKGDMKSLLENFKQLGIVTEDGVQKITAYQKELNEAAVSVQRFAKISKELGVENPYITSYAKRLEDISKNFIKVGNDGSISFEKVATGLNAGKKAVTGLKSAVRGLGQAFKANLPLLAFTAIVGALTAGISALNRWRKEAQRIRDIVKDTKDNYELQNGKIDEQVVKMESLVRIAEDTENSEETRKKALKDINAALALQNEEALTLNDTFKATAESVSKVGAAVRDWADDMKRTAKISYLASQIAEKEANVYELTQKRAEAARKSQPVRANRLKNEIDEETKAIKWLNEQLDQLGTSYAEQTAKREVAMADPAITKAIDTYSSKLKELNNQRAAGAISEKEYKDQLDKAKVSAYQAATAVDDYSKEIDKLSDSGKKVWNEIAGGFKAAYKATQSTSGGGSKKNSINELLTGYTAEIEKLNNLKKNGIITEDDFSKQAIDAARKTYEELMGIENIVQKLEAMGKKDILNELLAGFEKSKLSDIQQTLKDYDDTLKSLANQRENGALSEYQYKQAVKDANIELFKQISAIDDIEDKLNKLGKKEVLIKIRGDFNESVNKDLQALLSDGMPKYKPRDNSLDFKKSGEQIAKEELDVVNDYIKEMDAYVDRLNEMLEKGARFTAKDIANIEELKESLKKLKEEVPDLEIKVKIAAAEDSIKKLQQSLIGGVANGVKNLASDMDRVIRSVENIRDVFEDVDSTAWERFISVFNALAQAVEVVVSSIQAFNNLTQVAKELDLAKMAKETLAATLSQAAAQETADAAAITGLATKIAATEALAKAGWEAAAAAAATAAFLTPLPEVALPKNLAELSAAKAFAQGLKTFANGGIVGGSSFSGDKVLARVNSGEMVLNKAQQANLFKALNGNGMDGKVEFEIRGDVLKGVLKNYESKRSGGRK